MTFSRRVFFGGICDFGVLFLVLVLGFVIVGALSIIWVLSMIFGMTSRFRSSMVIEGLRMSS